MELICSALAPVIECHHWISVAAWTLPAPNAQAAASARQSFLIFMVNSFREEARGEARKHPLSEPIVMPILQESPLGHGAHIPARLQRPAPVAAYASIGGTTGFALHHNMPSICFDLLRLLSDASFHSGAALARELGASRAGISLALRELEDFGLKVYKVPGRGYRLAEPYDCLD